MSERAGMICGSCMHLLIIRMAIHLTSDAPVQALLLPACCVGVPELMISRIATLDPHPVSRKSLAKLVRSQHCSLVEQTVNRVAKSRKDRWLQTSIRFIETAVGEIAATPNFNKLSSIKHFVLMCAQSGNELRVNSDEPGSDRPESSLPEPVRAGPCHHSAHSSHLSVSAPLNPRFTSHNPEESSKTQRALKTDL